MAFIGLDVNITGTVPGCLGEQGVEHADDRRVIRRFQQIFDRGQVLHHALQVSLPFDFTDHGRGARFALCIGRADALAQVGAVVGLYFFDPVFAHDFTDATRQRRAVQMQRHALRIFFQQDLLGAGKCVGQRVAHLSWQWPWERA